MPTSFLRKYNEDYNPVNERLELKKKLIIRSAFLIVASLAFIVLRIINANRVFSDIAPALLALIYLIMIASSIYSLLSVGFIIFSLVSPSKANDLFNKIPYKVKKGIYTTIDWVVYIPICICFALYIYTFAFRIQLVSGPSMENSFYDGDRVISIYDNNIRRGDVVIANLDTNKNKNADEDEYIIKRVIGVPGDIITYTREGLFINNKYVSEPYINQLPSSINQFDKQFVIYKDNGVEEYYTVIPDGYYFLMGDNRNNSNDSRKFGLFSDEDIVSIVVIRVSGLDAELVERGVLE